CLSTCFLWLSLFVLLFTHTALSIILTPSLHDALPISEKYSKLRPHSGERLMFRPGPSTTATSSIAASVPIAAPTRSASPGSKLAPSATAGGKQVAGTLGPSPGPEPASLRSPCGPSVTITAGRPTRSMALVCQASAPLVSPAFSATVRSAGVTERSVSLAAPPGTGWEPLVVGSDIRLSFERRRSHRTDLIGI